MTFATFILSSGRCGTQWLAKHLGEIYGDRAVVTHEPLRVDYLPRRMLGLDDPTAGPSGPRLLEHVAAIERTLETKDYIECGWPCYAAIPYYAERFEDRVRIVHLPRHPVWSASSMVSHHYYVDPPRRDKLTEKALLTPFDQGTRFADYGARWGALSAFEKCLYFWAEIHALGLELEPSLGAPWLRLTSEEMFGRDGIGRLLRFLELPERPAMTEAIGDRFDRYSFKTLLQWDVDVVKGHPKVIEVAERLGYDPLEVDPRKIDQRYAMRPRASAPAAPETRDAAKLRQDIPIIGADVEDFGRLRAASKDHSPAFREALDGLRGYCLFVGVPASGLDLVGALLDAHPNIVVAHELDTLKFLGEGFDRLQISWLMAENARRMAAAGRHWGADSLAVPGQWQGRYDKLSLLGDQSGGATSLAASQNPLLIDHLTGVFEERVTFIHVVRNPFDAIAMLAVKTGQSLPNCASLYFQLSRANLFIRSRVGDGNFVTVWHEDLLADAAGALAKLCACLGETARPAYLAACAELVNQAPGHMRERHAWPERAIGAIEAEAKKIDFLARYRFDT